MSAGKKNGRKRLQRLLEHDLGPTLSGTERGTWTTTSSLPHEIRVHMQAGTELLRVSAGAVVGAKPKKGLLTLLNELNVEHAFCRWFVVDDKVLVAAEMPVASLRKGDAEHLVSMVLCLARLHAPMLALHGGRSVTDPPPSLAPDMDAPLDSWPDVLQASGTATDREFAVWLDELAGTDCWIDHDGDALVVVVGGTGTGCEYPFSLAELRRTAEELEAGEDDLEESW